MLVLLEIIRRKMDKGHCCWERKREMRMGLGRVEFGKCQYIYIYSVCVCECVRPYLVFFFFALHSEHFWSEVRGFVC